MLVLLFVVVTTLTSYVAAVPGGGGLLDVEISFDPVSLKRSLNKIVKERWERVASIVELEQQVEDYNADYIGSCRTEAERGRHRRLIIMPVEDTIFNPPMGVFAHNHVETGDTMSLPGCFQSTIEHNHVDHPWLFAISRIPDGVTAERVQYRPTALTPRDGNANSDDNNDNDDNAPLITHYRPADTHLERVVGSPLDFRAPPNYIFVPAWMMRALGVQPRDVVQVDLCRDDSPYAVPKGTMAKLRPHSSAFTKTISNTQAVLETELRHYASLTTGTTIAFDFNNVRYWFDVVELRGAPRGEKVPYVKVQDSDLATDFMTAKDVLVERLLKKQQRLKQQQEEKEQDDE